MLDQAWLTPKTPLLTAVLCHPPSAPGVTPSWGEPLWGCIGLVSKATDWRFCPIPYFFLLPSLPFLCFPRDRLQCWGSPECLQAAATGEDRDPEPGHSPVSGWCSDISARTSEPRVAAPLPHPGLFWPTISSLSWTPGPEGKAFMGFAEAGLGAGLCCREARQAGGATGPSRLVGAPVRSAEELP